MIPKRMFFTRRAYPVRIYRRPGPFGRILQYVPMPFKVFGMIAATAAIGIFLAPALIILGGPPILGGLWWLRHRRTWLEQELHNQRWSNMASYHLLRQSNNTTDKMPYEARNRILEALRHDENGIRGSIGNSEVSFGPTESLYQDFKGSSSGFTEAITIEEHGIFHGHRKVAIASIISKHSKMRVEVRSLIDHRLFVLKPSEASDIVIDVKPHHRR